MDAENFHGFLNDEIRMTKPERNPKARYPKMSPLEKRPSVELRHSDFVLPPQRSRRLSRRFIRIDLEDLVEAGDLEDGAYGGTQGAECKLAAVGLDALHRLDKERQP